MASSQKTGKSAVTPVSKPNFSRFFFPILNLSRPRVLNNQAVCQEDRNNKSYYVDDHHPVVLEVNSIRKEGAV